MDTEIELAGRSSRAIFLRRNVAIVGEILVLVFSLIQLHCITLYVFMHFYNPVCWKIHDQKCFNDVALLSQLRSTKVSTRCFIHDAFQTNVTSGSQKFSIHSPEGIRASGF